MNGWEALSKTAAGWAGTVELLADALETERASSRAADDESIGRLADLREEVEEERAAAMAAFTAGARAVAEECDLAEGIADIVRDRAEDRKAFETELAEDLDQAKRLAAARKDALEEMTRWRDEALKMVAEQEAARVVLTRERDEAVNALTTRRETEAELRARLDQAGRIERTLDAIRRDGTNPAHKIAELMKDLDDARATVERMRPVVEALGLETAWPAADVLDRLAGAAEHLLNDHDCDAHGYENVMLATSAAREIATKLGGAS